MSTTHKKVLVRRFTGDVLAGYLSPSGFVRHESPEPLLDLLDLEGRVVPLPLSSVKLISFVRDFNLADTSNPERLGRKSFLARPRGDGLWIRLSIVGGEMLEGLAAADLSLLTNATDDHGISLIPPDIRSNTQRVFVPRTAIVDLQVLAVVTAPSRRKPLVAPDTNSLQETLFSASNSS